MSSHCTTKLGFNTIFQNQMRSKICPASIKHVSYSIVRVWYRTSTLQWEQAASRALPLVLEKYLHTSLALALAASRRVCCAHPVSLPSTKKINDCTEAPKKTITFFFAGKIKIINKDDAGITNVKISRDLGVHATMFCASFPYSGNICAIYTCYASRLRRQFRLKTSSEKFWQH